MNCHHELSAVFIAGTLAIVVGCASSPKNSLLSYYQKFDDASMTDAKGDWPTGKFISGEIVPGKVGNALHVRSMKQGAMVSVPDGALGKRGCIEFWAKLDDGAGMIPTANAPVFFTVHAEKESRLAIGWSSNFGHSDSGLTFHYWGVAFSTSHKGCTSHPYSDVLKTDPAGWHHYALVWNYDRTDTKYNGSPLVVYIDGKERFSAGTPGPKRGPADLPKWQKSPQTLEFSISGLTKSGYTIDEFRIWSTDRRVFSL